MILGERLLWMVPKICVSNFYVTITNYLTEFGWLRGEAREKGYHWQFTVWLCPPRIPRLHPLHPPPASPAWLTYFLSICEVSSVWIPGPSQGWGREAGWKDLWPRCRGHAQVDSTQLISFYHGATGTRRRKEECSSAPPPRSGHFPGRSSLSLKPLHPPTGTTLVSYCCCSK